MPVSSQAVAIADDQADQPETLVLHFIRAHHDWNERACQLHDVARDGAAEAAALKQTVTEYQTMLGQFCLPGVTGQPVAFGQPASHDPQREQVGAILLPDIDHAVVCTCLRPAFSSGAAAEFEYELQRSQGRWYLQELYFMAGVGRLECL